MDEICYIVHRMDELCYMTKRMYVICYMVYISIIILSLNELTDDFLRPMMILGTEVVEALSS